MATTKRIHMVLQDHQAPGLVDFLYSLPERYESAFIRGLMYQWLLENNGEDLMQRVEEITSGPGGRVTVTTGLRSPADAPAPRPRRPRRPAAAVFQQAQTVMPGVVPPPAPVSGPAATLSSAVLSTPPIAAPVALPPAAQVIAQPPAPSVPTPAIASPAPQPPVSSASTAVAPVQSGPIEFDLSNTSADDLATLDQLGEMF